MKNVNAKPEAWEVAVAFRHAKWPVFAEANPSQV